MRESNSSETSTQLLGRGLEIQRHVIGALILRELHTRFGRDNIGYLWIIVEPMILAFAVALIHMGSAARFASGMRTVPFTLLGYCMFMIFRSIFLRGESALLSNQPLLFHRMVTIFDILLARAILDGAATVAAFVILLTGAVILGAADPPARLLVLMGAGLLMIWFSFALSMLVCALTHASLVAERLIHPITYILLPLSGAFYVLAWIPNPYRGWLAWFPMTQIFELARMGQFEEFDSPYVNVPYIIAWCLFLTLAGMTAIRRTRRHIHLH
jgi:capsular polysaccharide transport system permease protein